MSAFHTILYHIPKKAFSTTPATYLLNQELIELPQRFEIVF